MSSHQHAKSLPTETFHAIVRYLPRHSLKTLLPLQPHPLGQIASYVYFSTLALHFGMRKTRLMLEGEPWARLGPLVDDPLTIWHQKRSDEILKTILNDANFATRIVRLKLYAIGDSDQLDLLQLALPRLTRLRMLECSGLSQFRETIDRLPQTVPHLKILRLSPGQHSYSYRAPIQSPARIHQLQHLDQLILSEGWDQHISSTHLPRDLEKMPNIKKLHIGSPSGDIIGVSITPAFASTLTHLSPFLVDSKSPYEIVLRYGTNLRSLRVDGPLEQPSSQHFRRYSHALPYLTEFGVTHYSLQQDADFFPAVCDFLRPKAGQLVHLELKSVTNKYLPDRLGFKECWDMFPSITDPITVTAVSFPQLESLSITLLAGRKNLTLHYSNRIPPSVTSLSLSGSQLGDKVIRQLFKVPQSKKRIHRWPPNLHIISLDFGIARYQTVDLNQAQMVAKCIPTLRVLKFVPKSYQTPAYWSVCWDEASNIVRCEAWNERETSVLVEEMLDRFGCQDTSFG